MSYSRVSPMERTSRSGRSPMSRLGWGLIAACGLTALLWARNLAGAEVILQYFESRFATTTHRLPDVFMAGYGALWIPPTNRAEGGQSAGYDVFDRFDTSPFYGSQDELNALIKECKKANVSTYVDIVLNHN